MLIISSVGDAYMVRVTKQVVHAVGAKYWSRYDLCYDCFPIGE